MENTLIIGAGVAGVNAATKLVDNNYKGNITIIDMGNDPFNRKPEEVMTGFMGAGGWSDGKLTYHTSIGGHMSKYCGDEKAMELMDQVIDNFRRFHPKPEVIQCSHPVEEQSLSNLILVYDYFLYGILVQIIYTKLVKIGIHI